jgi:glycerol-3-phosphate dehydrogenase
MKRNIDSLSNTEYDLLVIGSGIYGAVLAWDGVLRGLRVALIDKADFGGATSANSLKIIHGGLRYLQQLDFRRMRESIRERTNYMEIAPHLVHPLSCVMPTYGHAMKGREVMFFGLILNDIISMDRNRLKDPEKIIPMGRIISKRRCLDIVPGIDSSKVTGGALWTDAQVYNSERFVLSFILSACEKGAQTANYVKVTGLLKKENEVHGVQVLDTLTNSPFEIRAKMVVNTTGGWIDHVLYQADPVSRRFQLSTALNLVINRRILSGYAAGITGQFQYRRDHDKIYQGKHVLFMTPWRHVTLVGTYHQPYHGHPDDMKVTEEDIQSFLREVNSAYPGEPIQRKEVSFYYKGFLPMKGIHPRTGEVILTKHYRIHDHQTENGLKGMISVIGVKFTTARDVAEKTLDFIFRKMGKKPPPCITQHTRLIGGEIENFTQFVTEAEERNRHTLPQSVLRHLVYSYGSNYPKILHYGTENSGYFMTLPGSSEVLLAEVIHAVRDEMAVKLSDVILRRTDLGSSAHPGKDSLKACAEIMAKELGWNPSRMKTEIEETEEIYRPAS